MAIVSFHVAATGDPLVNVAGEILRREIAARAGVAVQQTPGEAGIVLDLEPGIGTEGFRIDGPPGGPVRIAGNDGRGLLYGVGKFLRTCRFDDGRFTPSPWRGTSVAQRAVRGIYFASHFHNFYHEAPIAEVQRYVEELALWGCNALMVWFDMHHFAGLADPAARAMIDRLRAILQAAGRVGIGAGLGTLANEAYADSPPDLRADWTAGHDGYVREPGGHYHVEICPAEPGGMDYILKTRREMLEAFADLDIEYVWLWPYDQGGCTCSRCAPWGASGFLKVAEGVAGLVRRLLPGAKIILSTWYFDKFIPGEWEAFAQAVARRRPAWIDYILADDYGEQFPAFPLARGVPGGYPLLNFPEISMFGIWPWGGFGASVLPSHQQRIWETVGDRLAGGFPYSEGIFEDINKAVSLQHYWSGRDAFDTVREYAAYEYSPDVADAVLDVIRGMEAEHAHQVLLDRDEPDLRRKLSPPDGSPPIAAYDAAGLGGAPGRLEQMRRVETRLTDRARGAWRWRILYLRAGIDAELHHTGGRCSEQLDEYFGELTRIYHAENAYWYVCPPGRKALVRYFVEGRPHQQ